MPTINENKTSETRVLVFMPTGRDALLICRTLENVGIAAQSCVNFQQVEENIELGAGALLIAEEALAKGTLEKIIESFENQPIWSDLPMIIFASKAINSEKLLTIVGTRLNATIVERPIRIAMLISAVRGALRARQRQYQSRNLLNQLKESDHQKDMFLATLSHELRTPLNSILGWTQVLRNKSSAVDVGHGLEVIERNAKAQTEIISDILFVSRIITGKLSLDLKPIDLIPVIEEAVEVVLPSIVQKKINLNLSFDPKINKIKGDRERLKQVFWNLLSNSVKFTPSEGQINIRAVVKNENVEIEFSDTGIGIDSNFLPFIFERFRQADNSYTRSVGGLGLGLAIVRHLVEMHDGIVSVSSDGKNRGTSFLIKLPEFKVDNSDSDGNNQLTEAIEIEKPNAGIHVLLVEDNDDSREMLTLLFAQANLRVTAAANAAEAIKALENERPDILISDIGMPGEDGYDLIRKVRRLSPEQGGFIPAIALTGYASFQDRKLALEAGYQQHMSKPIDVDKLFELVKDLTNKETE